MKLLIDSHALIWYVDQSELLSLTSNDLISDSSNDLFLSAGSIWEIGIKIGLGKLVLNQSYRRWMTKALDDLGLTVLPVTVEYADVQASLPNHHGDPFDRLLVSQAIVEHASIVSADTKLDAYGVARLW